MARITPVILGARTVPTWGSSSRYGANQDLSNNMAQVSPDRETVKRNPYLGQGVERINDFPSSRNTSSSPKRNPFLGARPTPTIDSFGPPTPKEPSLPKEPSSDTKSDYSGGIGVGGVGLTASNYATPWASKTEADAANNAWMRQAGLMPGEQPVYNIANSADMDNFRKTYGMYGQDGTGGIFNPAGYSSNPYYLQTMTGITRDMTKGTILENVPDKIIGSLVKTATPWDNDSWIDMNTGATYSVQVPGSVNKGELRKALAGLTNQEYQYALGIQNRAAPLVSPGNLGGSDLSAAQQAILDTNRQHAAAMDGGYIPAIGVNAGLWQAGEMPVNRMVQDMVGKPPAQQPPTQTAPPQEDIVTQILKDLEVERRKKQQNIAEGT